MIYCFLIYLRSIGYGSNLVIQSYCRCNLEMHPDNIVPSIVIWYLRFSDTPLLIRFDWDLNLLCCSVTLYHDMIHHYLLCDNNNSNLNLLLTMEGESAVICSKRNRGLCVATCLDACKIQNLLHPVVLPSVLLRWGFWGRKVFMSKRDTNKGPH